MIELQRLNSSLFHINSELIETIESTPDTIITTTTGRKYIVTETIDEVVQKVIKYKRNIYKSLFSDTERQDETEKE